MGKITVITGGTSGIGRGIAEKILAESAKEDRIFVTYGHDEKKAAVFRDSLPEEKKSQVILMKADMSSYDEMMAFVEELKKRADHIDWLVSNAGISTYAKYEDYSFEEWTRIVNTNLSVPVFMVKELRPMMVEGGSVLFTGSYAGEKIYETRCVVNAAGVYADVFHNMVSAKKIHITPRKGEYYLLDKKAGTTVHHTIFQTPGPYGKGVLVTPTTHGNLLVGPTALDIEEKEGTNTTKGGLDEVAQKAVRSVPKLPLRQVITSFAGLRAHEAGHEFIIQEVEDAKGFFDCAGIESPGLTSAPAIGELVAELVSAHLHAKKKEHFVEKRKGLVDPKKLSREEYQELIRKNPAYGNMICRCETVTEGEIVEAIHRPIPAKSLDGVKRRTRAGMGRCQAGFCSPKTMEILAREWNVPMETITKAGKNSRLIKGYNKDRL